MRVARRALLASTLAAVVAPAVLRLARASAPRITLKLHHFFSAVAGGHERFLAPWARKIEAESGGRLHIDIFPSMQLGGAPADLFDQAREGIADITWAVPGNTPGRFPKIETFELPFVLSRRALVNSKALDDFAAANLQDEFHEVRALSFSCRDHGIVHANRIIRSIADLRGLRLHVPHQLAAEAVRALGAQSVIVPTPQIPLAITGHVINGCLDPWDAVPALRLNDLLKAHTDFSESALCTSTFVLAMNKASYERLPRDLKTVIDNNAGQAAAAMAGAMWDLEAKAIAGMVGGRGDPITVLTAEEVGHWRKATEPVIEAWLKQMKARKLDGTKLLADLRVRLAKYANEPEPQPPPPKVVSAPQQPPASPPSPPQQKIGAVPQAPAQNNAAVSAPPANAPPAPPAPAAPKRVPPKSLDIPM